MMDSKEPGGAKMELSRVTASLRISTASVPAAWETSPGQCASQVPPSESLLWHGMGGKRPNTRHGPSGWTTFQMFGQKQLPGSYAGKLVILESALEGLHAIDSAFSGFAEKCWSPWAVGERGILLSC